MVNVNTDKLLDDKVTEQAYNLIRRLYSNPHGYTIDIDRDKVVEDSKGYVVGINIGVAVAQNEIMTDVVTVVNKLKRVLRAFPEAKATINNPVYMGAWKDNDTQLVHFDIVQVEDDKEKALDFAVKDNQKAIYDLEKQEVIEVKGEK